MTEHARSDDLVDSLMRIEEQVAALQADVRRLGSVSSLPLPDDDLPPSAYAWLGAIDAPTRRRPQLPRLLLEALFLAAVAAAAAIAELDAVAIAGVMVGAWVLVALIEWAASRADRRQEFPAFAPAPVALQGADPAWFTPPVEQTLLDTGGLDPVTAITRLPDIEETGERRP